ncbi:MULTISPECIES: DUF6090 family protein [Roseivirga]|mgnify:CR=1 FL=1|uniref:Gliding motility-associated protein GldM N-terminal domain-containing protein n=1 Tax=Roseivirga thermotolerans TaxID=1758176 RepID=A0ABQ3IBE6_9BACT|nr:MULTISPECIES: DUF6090 family protein [Roseivirga]MEC7755843.1 DUF6090 family protein [Bacteroidota bacterium]GHE72402.1 hypothetical protein GCM10011340_30890 [Roseivirga thermotolerans]|tara:strand:+ start:6337 stop:7011 length:675 start_codon:yes stop_codon:yes gene_type:complete
MAKTKAQSKLKPYILDLIVVIAGISIAFALDNYSENRKQQQEEVLYLQALRDDLKQDKANLNRVVDSSKVLIQNVSETFQFLFSRQPLQKFQIKHITSTYTAPYFFGNTGTYSALINSGDLQIISSFELRNQLATHYNVSYTELHRIDDFIKNLVDNHLYPYMLKNIAFQQGTNGIRDTKPLLENEAINLMGSYYNFLLTRNKIYDQVIQRCDSLIANINIELK